MSQVTEQSVRFQTAMASIKLIQASAVLDLTEDDFDFLTRSEERFSRNAETDLVCRLLLEKKKLFLALSTSLLAFQNNSLQSLPNTLAPITTGITSSFHLSITTN